MRATSIQAYQQIRDSGLLSEMRWKVYDYLFNNGPLTANELTKGLLGAYPKANPSWHKRLSELERCGVAATMGTRVCSVSGNNCTLWDVTAALPMKKPKLPKTRPLPPQQSLEVLPLLRQRK